MKITPRIAAAVLAFLAGLAFRCWDHFNGVPGTRYVPNGHGWTGGPNVLQLTAFLWLLAGAVACLLFSLRDRLEQSFATIALSPADTFGKANSRSRGWCLPWPWASAAARKCPSASPHWAGSA